MAKKTKEDYAEALFNDQAQAQAEPKKEIKRVTVTYRPPEAFHTKLSIFCATHRLKKIDVYQRAHELFMEKFEKGEIKL